MIVFALVATWCGELALALIFGSQYTIGGALGVMFLSKFIIALNSTYIWKLWADGDDKFVANTQLGVAIASLILYPVMIRTLGLFGAALAAALLEAFVLFVAMTRCSWLETRSSVSSTQVTAGRSTVDL
jgi:O-antigen/teichoic acid export membrane protein